MDRYANTKSLD